MRRVLVLSAAVVSLALVAGACGSDDSGSTATDGTTATTAATAASGGGAGATGTAITISNFTFAPTPLNGQRAAAVTVENKDTATHTLTADDKSFDTGDIAPGTTGRIMLPLKPGDYAYHCEKHNYMKGVIHVGG
jgi:plastocyanin